MSTPGITTANAFEIDWRNVPSSKATDLLRTFHCMKFMATTANRELDSAIYCQPDNTPLIDRKTAESTKWNEKMFDAKLELDLHLATLV